jgi:F0F1-type ATP synthase assembly protein I
MKWIVIILVIALFGAGIYIVMTKGGVLEMQPEHAVEAPASHPTATVKK